MGFYQVILFLNNYTLFPLLCRCSKELKLCESNWFREYRRLILHYSSYISFGLGNVCETTSAWITMLVSVERYLSIRWPHLSKLYCTQRLGRIQVVAIACLATLFNLPFFFAVRRAETVFNNATRYQNQMTKFGKSVHYEVYTWVNFMLTKLIPLAILCIVSGLLIHLISSTYRRQRRNKIFLQLPSHNLVEPEPTVSRTPLQYSNEEKNAGFNIDSSILIKKRSSPSMNIAPSIIVDKTFNTTNSVDFSVAESSILEGGPIKHRTDSLQRRCRGRRWGGSRQPWSSKVEGNCLRRTTEHMNHVDEASDLTRPVVEEIQIDSMPCEVIESTDIYSTSQETASPGGALMAVSESDGNVGDSLYYQKNNACKLESIEPSRRERANKIDQSFVVQLASTENGEKYKMEPIINERKFCEKVVELKEEEIISSRFILSTAEVQPEAGHRRIKHRIGFLHGLSGGQAPRPSRPIDRRQRAQNRLTVLLIFVIVLFIIGRIPQAITYERILNLMLKDRGRGERLRARANSISFFAYSMNIFAYFSLNRHFRRQLGLLFCQYCIKHGKTWSVNSKQEL
ncbi:unnamed protein product [Protopolystoma xenopodis]|uniref:G-protein coupled receptors family 1 profile domain-containing protein n=1 Tax=Protopolystoma xenopodis TaxID=117903 RepID=A0A3S5BCI3_9PLAT|nr:unnamed protein product [Protopolystoma xenopodis]